MKALIAVILLSTFCFTTTAYGDPKAGFMTTDVALSVGDVPITVWYPSSINEKGSSDYIVPAYQSGSLDVIGTPVELRIPAGATRDVPIKGGTFPLILSNPGGESGNHMRLRNFPNNELLAAQSYIVVEAGRNVVDPIVDDGLLRSLMDHMLSHHPLRDSIDGDKIGVRALSFGGDAGARVAGAVIGIAPDERVRAVIFDEAFGCSRPAIDCSLVTIPIMLRDGSSETDAIDALVNAFPRFLVTLDNPAHVGFSTGTCGTVEAQRLASLAFQAAHGAEVQSDPRDINYVFVSPTADSIGDTAGFSARIFWNLGVIAGFNAGYGAYCGPQDGGPATPGLGVIMDNQTMIDTKQALNLAFWETVFGDGNSKKVEKAVKKLDSVTSFVQVTE